MVPRLDFAADGARRRVPRVLPQGADVQHLFEEGPEDDRANTERTKVSAGRVLAEQGQTGREAFVIVDGTARVLRNGRKVAMLRKGQIFGELSLLDRAPRNATVIADTDMELLVLGQREFATIVDASPAFARALLTGIARRMNESESRKLN